MKTMTDRAEIERLLQMTGRTLEGLPEDYSDEKLKVWNSFRDKTFGHVKSLEMANRILCQSDAIELLVGALRDALDKPMQKPLTLEDLAITRTGDEVWEEQKIGNSIHLFRTPALVLAYMCYQCDDDFNKYGRQVRAWKKLPTQEEMEAATWEI